MSIITKEAKQRIAAKSLQEQLEDCRRQMQRESGAEDMRTVDAHLEQDAGEFVRMPISGAD